jgi:hypothetical protein
VFLENKKPVALSPSRRVFVLAAYLRYYRGDREERMKDEGGRMNNHLWFSALPLTQPF